MHRNTRLLSATLVMAVLALAVLSTSTYLILPAAAHVCPPDAVSCPEEGRMTGGGRIHSDDPRWTIVTHGFELHCNEARLPNGFQVNWNNLLDVGSNRFHLETLQDVICWDDPAISPNPPNAPFDTLQAHGLGRYNGMSGAFIFLQLTDAGEPGRFDEAHITVFENAFCAPLCIPVLDVHGTLEFGNHQAHKETGNA